MSNTLIGYPNRTGTATLSAGSWESVLPLNNLKSRELAKVARSTDATTASTKWQADFGGVKNFRTFALANHNLSATAQWRVKLGSTAGASDIYDTGKKPVWTMTFDDVIEWGSATWWLGVAGDEYLRSPFAAIIVLDDIYNARHITVEITDTGNTDGYVQVGRWFAGSAIQPTRNAEAGNPVGWNDLSTIERAESGSIWTTERRRIRTASVLFSVATDQDTKWLHEMQRRVGTFDEVLYVPFPDDLDASQRYGFLGRMRQMTNIEFPYPTLNRVPLMLEEMA